MKSRMSLILTALVVILVSMVWVVRDRGNAGDVAMAPAMTAPPMTVLVQSVPAPTPAVPAPTSATEVSVTPPIPAAAAPQPKSSPLVHVASDGTINYTARDGDTVSDLAVAMLGTDSKAHREAIIAANPSLVKNPDRVLYGQTYSIDPSETDPAADQAAQAAPVADLKTSADTSAATPADKTVETATADLAADQKPDTARNLKYTAQPGDSVAVLAASLLGGDTKTNRDAVISGNASLLKNPDHLVAGKTYNIATTDGLAAAPDAKLVVTPTTQPDGEDADDAARMSVGRVLRYVAQPGDTVSKLATVLLGSDTEANRAVIINNNRSLKRDPNHLVAGKTYWIAAPDPVADTTTP
jgi:hypothetical protein